MTFSTCKPEINYFFDFFTPAPPDFTNIWSMKLCSARTATPGDPRESGAISPNISSGTEQCKRFSNLFTTFSAQKTNPIPGNHASMPLPPPARGTVRNPEGPPRPAIMPEIIRSVILFAAGRSCRHLSYLRRVPLKSVSSPPANGDAGGSGRLPCPPPPAMENRQKTLP